MSMERSACTCSSRLVVVLSAQGGSIATTNWLELYGPSAAAPITTANRLNSAAQAHYIGIAS